MKIIVGKHNIGIKKDIVNEKEINVNKCEFIFDEDITDDFVKEAYFTADGKTYKQIIENNECDIPYEAIEKQGLIEIGVVAYKVIDEETIIRNNPSPTYITAFAGSLKEAENSEPITPSEMEQFEQALQDALANIDEGLGIKSITKTSTSGLVDTYTITYGDGLTSTFTVTNGEAGYTPVRGTDYWTTEDIATIENYCNSLVLGALGGSY